jgi:hypothetical protein
MATITIASTQSSKGRVHIWPKEEFKIDCLSKKTVVAVRPKSLWISDENLKEHETFTLPDSCFNQRTITVDIHLSPNENLEEYTKLFIKTVKVREPELQLSPRLSAYIGVKSFHPGDMLPIKINASGPINIEISHLGAKSNIIYSVKNVVTSPQKFNPLLSFRDGVDWKITQNLIIPDSWRPGYYMAKISSSQEEFFAYFLVSHSKNESPPPIAILVPTLINTILNLVEDCLRL